MKRVLVVYYSQSGDVRRAAEALTAPLAEAGAELVWEEIRPRVQYPSPWRNVQRFFNVMPECILQVPPPIELPTFDPRQHFDLVILAYQVWFLSPSLPVQGFFRTEQAEVLRGAKVVTLSVSRNMWQNASEAMKTLLARAGATHTDNIVVTHQGAPSATFVTTTRSLFSGKRDRLLGVLPEAGVAGDDMDRLARLGAALARQLDHPDFSRGESMLRGMDAVEINRRYVFPELLAWYVFRFWARLIRGSGRVWIGLRHLGVFLFGLFLLFMILTLPIVLLVRLLLSPLINRRLAEYAARLAEPTGSSSEALARLPDEVVHQGSSP